MKVTMSYDANNAYGPGSVPGPGSGSVPGPGSGFGGNIAGAQNPDDLSLPLYGASFGQAVKRFFKNYVNFKGRASRSEFWYAYLFLFLLQLIPLILYIIGIALTAASASTASMSSSYGSTASSAPSGGALALTAIGGILLLLISLATLLPYLGACWRRLHDANFSGGFWFLNFIPSVGSIIVLVLLIMPPKPEGQRFDVR